MIKLPHIVGKIKPVPLSSYSEIINNYVNKVGRIEQVSSIVQMGSFTKPGISDIDLIVTLKPDMPFPRWTDISLKEISKQHKDAEILAHDIFVIPENIAQNAEAYFYIDRQNVLKGKRLGGSLSSDITNKCKEFLAIEYGLFSLAAIAGLLLSDEVSLRNMILLISSMRHTSTIAFGLKVISEDEKNSHIQQVENLRSEILDSKYSLTDVGDLFEKFITLLNQTIAEIAERLSKNILENHLKESWMVSSKSGMIGVKEDTAYLKSFLDIVKKQKGSFFSKHTKVFSVPIKTQMHIGAYLDGDQMSAVYFRNNFKMVRPFHDKDELNIKARELRGKVVVDHWRFLSETGYHKSSGWAYCGLSYPNKKTYKTFLQKCILSFQFQKLVHQVEISG